MAALNVIDEQSGETLGQITLADDGTVVADPGPAADVFSQFRKRIGDDRETFDALAGGWSNGYSTIRAIG